MKAYDIVNELFKMAEDRDYSDSCDTLKAGDKNAEVNKVAVSMFATVNVLKEVTDWGAQLLIVHEPLYYNDKDIHSDEKIENEKRRIIEESGLAIYRYHDHTHYTYPDIIAKGELKKLDLKGEVNYTDIFDLVRIKLDEEITANELCEIIKSRLGLKHVRICGAKDVPCRNVSAMFGAPGGVFAELKNDECEILLVGETCEWNVCEYARDASQLGFKKAVIIMGHVGSEREGMKLTTEILKEKFPQIDVKYFECGEVYE